MDLDVDRSGIVRLEELRDLTLPTEWWRAAWGTGRASWDDVMVWEGATKEGGC
jgi:hypothetical protein